MADADAEDRTEQPTAKRLREARERGQIARSRELGAAAALGAGTLALASTGPSLAAACASWLRGALSFTRAGLAEPDLAAHAGRLAVDLFLIVAPLVAAAVFAALVAPLAMGGLAFSVKAMTPDFSRLNPVAGLRRLVEPRALAELAKALLRVALVGAVAWFALRARIVEFLSLAAVPVPLAIAHGASLVLFALAALTLALVGIAAIDVPYQLWRHRRDLRMTREEIRDELKESEGRPEVKGRIRRLQHQMANRRMLEAVPRADAVVVNPTHYAVALAYDGKRMRAPRVVAKGVDLIAQAIRETAQRHGVAIVEAPSLARALYRQVELDREVPVALYAAVAQVLTFIYQLRAWRRHGGRMPQPPTLGPGETPGGEADPDSKPDL